MYKKARFLDRLFAFIIDQLLFFLGFFILTLLFSAATPSGDFIENLTGVAFLLYNILFVWQSGATVGKRILKIKVVTTDYEKIGFWRVVLRESLGKILSSILNLGYLWVLIDKKRQGWHDKLGNSLVVKLNEKGQLIKISEEETPNKKVFVIFVILGVLPVLLGLIFIFIYLYGAQPHRLVGSAMVPNYTDGQYYLSNKIEYRSSDPKRGDVVVYKNPKDKSQEFYKRIIGLPGEEIKIEEGKVYINGEVLYEQYLESGTSSKGGEFIEDGKVVKIPENEYFLMGDNRNHSFDSRNHGTVRKEDIIGKLWYCYWNCFAK